MTERSSCQHLLEMLCVAKPAKHVSSIGLVTWHSIFSTFAAITYTSMSVYEGERVARILHPTLNLF